MSLLLGGVELLAFIFEVHPVIVVLLLHLSEVLLIGDLLLLTVRGFLILAEDLINLIVEILAAAADEEKLERVLDRDFVLAVLVVHEKLNEVEESPTSERKRYLGSR